ncbi:sulfatase-like hydrolase/transferase [Gimesia aquarii]|uniref:Arylsulfatase n=1 Tax=Gimesia aquarii TaxID=2527964 RepID=A0A517WQ57_9PLAN|nr:sulfatase-like hydrolase/transferase [Gimesia aquarii]QDU07389.1 Arylsulfatase [Gimesia aquarii]
MQHTLNQICLGLFFFLIFFSDHVQAAERPNFLIIFTDDQGLNDVGCYGSEIPTPNIDQLAKEGLLFRQYYSASSICTPSRFGLLTGRNPSRSQDRLLGALMFMSQLDKNRGIQPGETTIAEVLQQNDYQTALIGKWHLGHGNKTLLPTSHGFDLFRGHTGGCIDYFTMTYGNIPDWYHNQHTVSENGYATDLITEEAEHFLKGQQIAKKPFFLFLSYNAPHFGKGWSPGDQSAINIMQARGSDLKRVGNIKDKVRREFAAMTVALDDGIGRVMTALKNNGLDQNTLVIFMTDHGGTYVYGGSNQPFRGAKASLFEGGIRVPCIMRWPGKIQAATETNEVTWALDLFPTICQLVNVDTGGLLLDGQDISSLLTKQTPVGTRELFWQLGPHKELKRGRWTALRQADWKYIQNEGGEEFLFDLKADPYEKQNRVTDKPGKLKELQKHRDELVNELSP